MHIPVWIMTSVTDQMDLGQAFREAERLAERFRGKNINPHKDQYPDHDIMPPISWDDMSTGGRWDGQISMTEQTLNHTTGEEAAAAPRERMPTAVIAPTGTPSSGTRRTTRRSSGGSCCTGPGIS